MNEALFERVLSIIKAADLTWNDITNTEMKDPDPDSVRTIGTGFFALDDRPRTFILSMHKDSTVYGLTENAESTSFGRMPGTPEQLRALWDAVVLKVVAE